MFKNNKKFAFTLAEVLITLGIIGVVAAISLPSFISKINNFQYEIARKKVINSVGEAGRQVIIQGNFNSAYNAKDFVDNILSKKLKIIKTCETDNLQNCGLSTKILTSDGKKLINMPKNIGQLGMNNLRSDTMTYVEKDKPSYGFIMSNGYSVNLFYNPNCIVNTNASNNNAVDYVCINVIYDVNGLHNPNQVGKDVGFLSILYSNESSIVVAPNVVPESVKYTPNKYNSGENWDGSNYLFSRCNSINKDYYPTTKDELLSIGYNSKLVNLSSGDFVSMSKYPNSTALWHLYMESMRLLAGPASLYPYHFVCVKK